jgi:hypothetical protein
LLLKKYISEPPMSPDPPRRTPSFEKVGLSLSTMLNSLTASKDNFFE